MTRNLVLFVAVFLTSQAAPVARADTKISVKGQLSGGAYVLAECTVSNTGQVGGTGKLFGTNANGYAYAYPFTIKRVSTANGKLILSGNFAVTGAPPVTLTASVPSGPQTFNYVVNGQTITMTGQGTVTVK